MSTVIIVTCVHCDESFFDDSAAPLENCPHCLLPTTIIDQNELFAHEDIENWCPNALLPAAAAPISAPELLIEMRRNAHTAIDRTPPQSLPQQQQHHHCNLWHRFFFDTDSDGETDEDGAENNNGPDRPLVVHDGLSNDTHRLRTRSSLKRNMNNATEASSTQYEDEPSPSSAKRRKLN